MIYLDIMGGLGNQLFQYATSLALSKGNFDNITLLTGNYDNYYFGQTLEFSNLSIPKLHYKPKHRLLNMFQKKYTEKHNYYEPRIWNMQGDYILRGYFQSWRYFDSYKNILHNIFTHNGQWSVPAVEYKNQILNTQNVVAIHFRLYKYYDHYPHGIDLTEYYQNAIALMQKIYGNNCTFLVFTDNIELLGKLYPFAMQYDIVQIPDNSLVTYQLLRQCPNIIMANSTFSWWASYMNYNDNPVIIAPSQFIVNDDHPKYNICDLYPNNWLLLACDGQKMQKT